MRNGTEISKYRQDLARGLEAINQPELARCQPPLLQHSTSSGFNLDRFPTRQRRVNIGTSETSAFSGRVVSSCVIHFATTSFQSLAPSPFGFPTIPCLAIPCAPLTVLIPLLIPPMGLCIPTSDRSSANYTCLSSSGPPSTPTTDISLPLNSTTRFFDETDT